MRARRLSFEEQVWRPAKSLCSGATAIHLNLE
jgi:hypothetical protein